MEETASHAFDHTPRVHPLLEHVGNLTAHIALENLVLIDRAYACDDLLPPYSEVKRVVFLSLLATARMVI